MTNKEILYNTLSSSCPLCDDCLSELCNIKPRQSVNQNCTSLFSEKKILRDKSICGNCHKCKIVNTIDKLLYSIVPEHNTIVAESVKGANSNQIQTIDTQQQTKSELFKITKDFFRYVIDNNIELYNEFSLQHEYGIYLRSIYNNHLVQFERNIRHFSSSKFQFTKKEIDVSVISKDRSDLKYAIELKYPRNGQHPETMFNFCKDIAFIEELTIVGFSQAALLILVDDPLFYSGGADGIYGYFRSGQPLTGRITKPTGQKNEHVTIKKSYRINWHSVTDKTKFALIEVNEESANKR